LGEKNAPVDGTWENAGVSDSHVQSELCFALSLVIPSGLQPARNPLFHERSEGLSRFAGLRDLWIAH